MLVICDSRYFDEDVSDECFEEEVYREQDIQVAAVPQRQIIERMGEAPMRTVVLVIFLVSTVLIALNILVVLVVFLVSMVLMALNILVVLMVLMVLIVFDVSNAVPPPWNLSFSYATCEWHNLSKLSGRVCPECR